MLWEGRYKACLFDNEVCVLRCGRYIDLNPVRARMIDDPTRYPWSNCAALTGLRSGKVLSPHAAHVALASSPIDHGRAYQALLRERCPNQDLEAVRLYLQQQRA